MVVKFTSYPADSRICVVTTLQMYLACINGTCCDYKQLLLSYLKPFKLVSRSTISRWIKVVMHSSGINVKCSSHTVLGLQPHPKQVQVLFLQIRFYLQLGGAQPPHLPSFTISKLMLITVLLKVVSNLQTNDYFHIAFLQSNKLLLQNMVCMFTVFHVCSVL